MRSILAIVGIYFAFHVAAFSVFAEEDAKWFKIESSSFTIYYEQAVDLKAVADRLASRELFMSRVYDPNPTSAPTKKIAYRLDRLLKRVKEVLDMHPDMPKVRIKIFKNMFSQDTSCALKGDTIYVYEDRLSSYVIAHEMARAVIDNYFSALPSEKAREILASYVDRHLEGD